MEYLSKREFYKKYATKKDKSNIKSAAIFAYICAGVSLGLGLLQQNYSVIIDVALIAGLGLGIHLLRSRVCASLLLLYGFANSIFGLLSTGRIQGWWLILAGFMAVQATFHFHKAYRLLRTQDILPQEEPMPEPSMEHAPQQTEKKHSKKEILFTSLPFLGLVVSLLLLWYSVSPALCNMRFSQTQTPVALLMGYESWYKDILLAWSIGLLVVLAAVAVAAWKGVRTGKTISLMVVCLAFPVFLGWFMIGQEGVPTLLNQAQADIAQIQNGQLQEATVWVSPKLRPARLPGPFSQGQPEPVTRYGGIGEDTGGEWMSFYVPNLLDFTLDQDALYHENQSIAWNQENARQYRIRYTDNFYLVVDVEPLD